MRYGFVSFYSICLSGWKFRKYDTKTIFRVAKQLVLLVNLLLLVPPSRQIQGYSAHSLPNKINLQLLGAEQLQLDLEGLVHQPQTKAQQRR